MQRKRKVDLSCDPEWFPVELYWNILICRIVYFSMLKTFWGGERETALCSLGTASIPCLQQFVWLRSIVLNWTTKYWKKIAIRTNCICRCSTQNGCRISTELCFDVHTQSQFLTKLLRAVEDILFIYNYRPIYYLPTIFLYSFFSGLYILFIIALYIGLCLVYISVRPIWKPFVHMCDVSLFL